MIVELWVVEKKPTTTKKKTFTFPALYPAVLELWSLRDSLRQVTPSTKKESGCGAHRRRNQSATWDRRAAAGDSVASSIEQEEVKGRRALVTSGWPAAAEVGKLLDPAYPSGEKGVDGWRWTGGVGRWQRAGFDPPGSHVGQELVGDLSQHFLSQAGHAENVVTTSVNVVPERDELEKMEEQNIRLDLGNSPL